MNILIVGEYSGVSKNLKAGFTRLGHSTTIFSDGDGWKKIKTANTDFCFDYKSNYTFREINLRGTWRLKSLFQYFQFKKSLQKLNHKFDFVIIINYEFLRTSNFEISPKFSFSDLQTVSKKKAPFFLMACGDDLAYLTEGCKMRYWPHDKSNLTNSKYFKKKYLKLFDNLPNYITAVIPGMYEYANAYRTLNQAKELRIEKSIPFALDCNAIQPYNVINDGIIKIYHGINREDFKGTPIIREALDIIKKRYPEKVDVRIEGSMPLEEYLKVLKESNIIIDQCKSYSYGMNAIYGMALGKLVFSGNEKECLDEFGRQDIPIVNILPEVNDIVANLEKFIINPHLILEFGKRSREFVVDFHNEVTVANNYISLMQTYTATKGD